MSKIKLNARDSGGSPSSTAGREHPSAGIAGNAGDPEQQAAARKARYAAFELEADFQDLGLD